ncbi:hypothetical protein MPER_12654 [Moniliophthora perniciosa FA553]|nr:hypothetical protein MPER_12654 [Moniliophthora perniciosa FA553]
MEVTAEIVNPLAAASDPLPPVVTSGATSTPLNNPSFTQVPNPSSPQRPSTLTLPHSVLEEFDSYPLPPSPHYPSVPPSPITEALERFRALMMGQTEPTPSPSPPANRPRQVTFAPRTGEVSDDGGAVTTPSSNSRSSGPENLEPREWHLALDAAIARHSDMLPPTATVTVANSATREGPGHLTVDCSWKRGSKRFQREYLSVRDALAEDNGDYDDDLYGDGEQ